MIKTLKQLFAIVALIATANILQAAEPQSATPNYELAERFSPTKMSRLVPQTAVRPNWFEKSNKFWYAWKSIDDINYYIVDPATGKTSEMWSMAELAEKVTLATNY